MSLSAAVSSHAESTFLGYAALHLSVVDKLMLHVCLGWIRGLDWTFCFRLCRWAELPTLTYFYITTSLFLCMSWEQANWAFERASDLFSFGILFFSTVLSYDMLEV